MKTEDNCHRPSRCQKYEQRKRETCLFIGNVDLSIGWANKQTKSTKIGLNNRILHVIRKSVNKRFSEYISCIWQILCNFSSCINRGTLLETTMLPLESCLNSFIESVIYTKQKICSQQLGFVLFSNTLIIDFSLMK